MKIMTKGKTVFRDKGTRKQSAETPKLTFPFLSQQRGLCLAGALVGKPAVVARLEATATALGKQAPY